MAQIAARRRYSRVSFPTALAMEYRINEEAGGSRFAAELANYIPNRAAELEVEEVERKRLERSHNAPDPETILEEFKTGACAGGEWITPFPVYAGSHRQRGGGVVGLGRVVLGACATAIGENLSSGFGGDVHCIEEGRLMDRSFELDVLHVHRDLRRAAGVGKVVGVVFLISSLVISIIIISVLCSLRV